LLEFLLGWVELVLCVEVDFLVLVQVDLVVLDLDLVGVLVDRVVDVHLVELLSGDRFL
jgi:hypothetical protein